MSIIVPNGQITSLPNSDLEIIQGILIKRHISFSVELTLYGNTIVLYNKSLIHFNITGELKGVFT